MSDERVDLTKLIEHASVCKRPYIDPYLRMHVTPAERDEIVLALRVLRVLQHPDCDGMWISGTGKLVIKFASNPVARRLLDDAERLLGLAAHGKDGE